MKLLVIISNSQRASFRQRVAVYLDTLRQKGIDPEVVTLPPGSLSRQKLFKRAAEFDGVFLHKKSLNYFDARWLAKYGRKIIYDFDDAIMYSARVPACSSPAHFKPFRRTVELADMVIAGNSYLAEHALRFNGSVRILPTGLDTKAYRTDPVPKKDDKVRLVWIGSRSTLRYLAEIKPALEEIGARFNNVVLRMICDQFFNLQNMPVEKRPWSLETQVRDLVSSDIGLAPLPDNRFTRGKCGFKILQYAAASLPSIASPVGVNAEYVTDGLTGFHASSIWQWVDRTAELIENAGIRKQMGDAARGCVEKFDTDVLAEELCSLLKSCMEEEESSVNPGGAAAVGTSPAAGAPTVSICIPTYNRREYLRETLDSILAQTYKDFEIVVVDDGSTDGTEEMIEKLGVPIVYHWQPNSGLAAARNKLIDLAQGRYVAFIDSDDLLVPDAIERMLEVMATEPDDVIVYGSYFRIDKNGKICGRSRKKLHSGNITEHLFQSIFVHSCGSMFPSKVFKDSMMFDASCKICADYDLWLRLSLKYRYIALAEPTFKRRRHSDNLSYPSYENYLTQLRVLERFYRERGGCSAISQNIARRVLGIEGRRAGRYAVKEGLYDQACELLGESFQQRPNLKTALYLARALIARRWASL